MSDVTNTENTVDMINYVTIPIREYRDLVTKVARYELLQEQERKQEAAMEAFKENLTKNMHWLDGIEKPAPVAVRKSDKVDKTQFPPKKVKPAISTEISKK